MRPISSSSPFERWLLQRVLSATGHASLRFVLKGRESVAPTGTQPVATLIIRDIPTLFKMAFNPEIGFGDGYASGNLEVEGELAAAIEAVYRAWPSFRPDAWLTRRRAEWLERLKANTPRRSRDNVHHHYDLNADFYRLWLDREMLYTCAYFPTPSSTLEEAQIAKMDYVCRKLQFQPGETVVEAGCGWGALALHMARHYGVRVKAFNLSHEQIVFARQRARKEGLAGKVEFIEDDYRNIAGRFDAFRVRRDAGACGVAQLCGAGQRDTSLHWCLRTRASSFHRPQLSGAIERLDPEANLSRRLCTGSPASAGNLRAVGFFRLRRGESALHYAKTLEHWLERFERCAPEISAEIRSDNSSEHGGFIWLGLSSAFRVGTMQLFQVTFAGSQCQRIPWTREHLYEAQHSQAQGSKWMHCDVLIVGGGPAGSSCAWRLRNSGLHDRHSGQTEFSPR